ncbi:hypothetical protein, partial [Faecalibaculum rodentium]|uniref:hypothetical protein n=1 Tax=Faecalibaculum rodentium TaxID=1702221 RepID=UPI00260999EB
WRTETEAFQLLFRRRIDPLLSAIPESDFCPALLSPLCHQRRNIVFLLHNFDILSFPSCFHECPGFPGRHSPALRIISRV